MGALKGRWIAEDRKIDILVMIAEAKQKGVCISSACALLSIKRRRITRWSLKRKQNESLKDLKPGPKTLLHNKLLPEESAQVLDLAKKEEYADLSHRTLCVTAWDLKLFFVSFSSVYRILRQANLMSMRGHHHHHNRNSLPPVRKELTGPDQRWCWDISYLLTHEKGLFLYLFLLLDEYSRKVIQWLISWHGTSAEAKLLIDGGLTDENILELPMDQRPEIFNDRGRQMKAKNIKKMFEDHGMPQRFARPRTPNDNPFVESFFGTAKTAPQYPERFRDDEEAIQYFKSYFHWYNYKHWHSGIGYITPDQCHRGLKEKILAERRTQFMKQRQLRKEVNHQNHIRLTNSPDPLKIDLFKPSSCSVIGS